MTEKQIAKIRDVLVWLHTHSATYEILMEDFDGNPYMGYYDRIPIVKVIASPAYRIPIRREFHLINFSNKAVVDVYLLLPAAIRAFYGFMHHDFFNQGV